LTNGVAILPLSEHWTADAADLDGASSGAREFVVGPENRLASATIERLLDISARSVSEAGDETGSSSLDGDREVDRTSDLTYLSSVYPLAGAKREGERFAHLSPLVFCGASGTGKSHLVNGLAEAWKREQPNDEVVLTKASYFAAEYAEAVDKHDVPRWRTQYRSVDLFVLEDLAQLSAKPAAQVELLNTLDSLAVRGALAVITSRLSPQEQTNLLTGLQSRLMAGLCVPLVLPEVHARREILARLCASRQIALGETVLGLLARSLAVSVPELSGVLQNLEHAARAAGKSLDDRLIHAYLSQRGEAHQPPLRLIVTHTARHFALRVTDLRSASRRRGVVVARDIAMYLARQLTSNSLKQIGDYFGGRDHTTVLHGCRKTESLIASDAATRDTVLALRQRLAMQE
jgi:chromosomal replication initiator protein